MTINTKKLAFDIAQVMELAARKYKMGFNFTLELKQMQGVEVYEATKLLVERGEAFTKCVSIILQLIDIVKAQESCLQYFENNSCNCAERFFCAQCDTRKALALAAPLINKTKGKVK
jgi:hypothetical protein